MAVRSGAFVVARGDRHELPDPSVDQWADRLVYLTLRVRERVVAELAKRGGAAFPDEALLAAIAREVGALLDVEIHETYLCRCE